MYWGIKLNRLIVLFSAFLFLTSGSGIGAAADVYVNSTDSIQTAVNNATSGDIIILKPGTYTENIEINKDNLIISSESGNPDDTIITAKNSRNHVITLQANNVKISGLGVTGTKESYTGIYLSGCNNCIIENSKIQNNGHGIYLLRSKGNTLSNNKVTNNGDYGILFSTATDNILSGNTASDNRGRGIHIGTSNGNTLSGNTISSNGVYGLFVCPKSNNNLVYNNYFNNTVNAEIRNGIGNAYHTAKTEGINIIGGPYLGGNFWAEPDGTGFSETAIDADGDGIAESSYRLSNSIYSDELPLVLASKPQQPVLPVANFKMDDKSGPAPFSVQFTDLSENAVSWSWDFESDGNIDSTDKNPVHTYTIPGKYTAKLTVSNENGTASKTLEVIVLEAQKEEKVYPVADFSISVTSGYAPLSVQFTDLSKNTTSRNWDFGDGATSTDQNPVYIYSTAGTYTVSLAATNENGTASKAATVTVMESSSSGGNNDESSGGSSGGKSHRSGGGGGGSPEPARNVQVKELSQTFITAGREVKFDLRNNATCVVYVTFDAKKSVGKTTTIVEVLKAKSSLVSKPLSDEIYKYFNLWVGNAGFATSKNIENPVICFKVEKDWIEDNDINKTSIALNRYNSGKWEQLPVNLSEEDDRFLYFTGQTPEFSFFAITGKTESKEAPVTDLKLDSEPESQSESKVTKVTNLNGKNAGAINSSSVKYALERKTSERSPGFETIYGIISLISLFLYKKVKPRN